jgi:hypothetical protein
MGKSILLIGLLASMSLAIGSLFKFMHMPGAEIMMYGGLVSFSFLFAPLWFFSRMKVESMTGLDKFSWSIGVASGIVLAIGGVCEFLHYPGAGIMVFAGGSLFALIYLPSTFYGMYQKQAHA